MFPSRTIFLAALGLVGLPLYALNFKLHAIFLRMGLMGPGTGFHVGFLLQFLPLGALYLAGIGLVLRRGTAPPAANGAIHVILLFALMYRILLVPTPPMLSSDMYRYLWDGRVQAHGINPYRYPPDHQAVERLRDDVIYPHINRKASRTIYPAGAQLLFYALHGLGARDILTFKGVVAAFDMGTVLLLVMTLARLGMKRERVLIYAWNPLVIYELGNNGHLDGVMVFFVVLALLLLMEDRPLAKISSLAISSGMKLYPAIILPAMLTERKARGLLAFLCIFGVIYLPYLTVGEKVLGFLPEYITNPYESFNLGLKAYIMRLFPTLDHLIITKAFTGLLLMAAGIVWIQRKEKLSAMRFAYVLASLQIVLGAASLHPWYVIWIIPFLCFFTSAAWLYFSIAVPLSYLKYGSATGALPPWVWHTEYVPFFILLGVEFFIFLRSAPASVRRAA